MNRWHAGICAQDPASSICDEVPLTVPRDEAVIHLLHHPSLMCCANTCETGARTWAAPAPVLYPAATATLLFRTQGPPQFNRVTRVIVHFFELRSFSLSPNY